MENKLGRLLGPNEIVHHDDEDKENDTLSNLVLKTRSAHARDHARCAEGVLLVCGWCRAEFRLKPFQVRLRRRTRPTGDLFCSRSCGAYGKHDAG